MSLPQKRAYDAILAHLCQKYNDCILRVVTADRQVVRSGTWQRTRTALLSATLRLIAEGTTPSVAQAAAAAGVSRRTAYRYFPTKDQLLTEAALETLRPGIESAFASIHEPEVRLEAAVRAMLEQAVVNERLLRTMVRLTVERDDVERPADGIPLRGTRRVAWIESGLEPIRDTLTGDAFERLVSALCLCVGPEALIVLRDIRGVDQNAATEISVWAAKALLAAAAQGVQSR